MFPLDSNCHIHHRVLLVISSWICLLFGNVHFHLKTVLTNLLMFLNNNVISVVMILTGYQCKRTLGFCLPFLILYLQSLHRFVCSFRCYASVCSYITPTTVFTVRWAPGCRRSILDTASWCHPIPMYLVCLSNHGRIHLCYTGARS